MIFGYRDDASLVPVGLALARRMIPGAVLVVAAAEEQGGTRPTPAWSRQPSCGRPGWDCFSGSPRFCVHTGPEGGLVSRPRGLVDNSAYFFAAGAPPQSDHRTVTNRKAIQELVELAMAAEAGEGPFAADGLTATVAIIPDDEARLVEVSDQAKVIFSSCFVGPGAARPTFYPADVPFDNRAPTSVVWGPEQGTLVVWPVPSGESVLEAYREQVEQFAEEPEVAEWLTSGERVLGGSSDKKEALLSEFAGNVSADLKDRVGRLRALLASGASSLADDVVASIVRFHEQEGWLVHRDQDGPVATTRVMFVQGDHRRILTSVALMGATTVMLQDQPKG